MASSSLRLIIPSNKQLKEVKEVHRAKLLKFTSSTISAHKQDHQTIQTDLKLTICVTNPTNATQTYKKSTECEETKKFRLPKSKGSAKQDIKTTATIPVFGNPSALKNSPDIKYTTPPLEYNIIFSGESTLKFSYSPSTSSLDNHDKDEDYTTVEWQDHENHYTAALQSLDENIQSYFDDGTQSFEKISYCTNTYAIDLDVKSPDVAIECHAEWRGSSKADDYDKEYDADFNTRCNIALFQLDNKDSDADSEISEDYHYIQTGDWSKYDSDSNSDSSISSIESFEDLSFDREVVDSSIRPSVKDSDQTTVNCERNVREHKPTLRKALPRSKGYRMASPPE